MKLKRDYEKHVELYRNGFLFDPESFTAYTDKQFASLPPDYEKWELEKVDLTAYTKVRLEEMGISKEDNLIELIGGVNIPDKQKNKHLVFAPNKFGDLQILQYSLTRKPYTYHKKGSSSKSSVNPERYNVQTRLHPLHEQMCEGKYDFSEAINVPFWHKSLIEKYEGGEEVKRLTITEGQIKAFKASLDGIPTTGLTSISHFRDSKTKKLHTEITDFINKCKVEEVVILWDGDCRNISSKALQEGEEINKRPFLFFWFVYQIRLLLLENFAKKKLKYYFATIASEDIPGSPKGIDDLLMTEGLDREELVKDYNKIGMGSSAYFHWTDITTESGVKKLKKFFALDSVKSFYNFHKDLINGKEFVYDGATYEVDNDTPVKKIDANVHKYKRIGIDYYKIDMMPVPTGRENEIALEEVLEPWNKTCIVDDHGKNAINHIERYNGFTNVASHVNYKQVIKGRWNLYHNVDHNPSPGKWDNIETLLKHLFQEQYEMVLDYITILYLHPAQKLPVVCLVSKEQGTGKSTFIYLMKLIFKQNMALISNSDLIGDFNAHWTSKVLVASEETMLEKKDAYEKIKSLSTAKSIMRNEKNKSQREIPCMVHFIFCSNHEDDFIKIDDYDSRLWIRKVSTIKKKIMDFDLKLEDEIPHFIDFIEKREIVHERKDRMYFSPEQFRTEAFDNIVKHSEPGIIKELREKLADLFIETGVLDVQMNAKLIVEKFGIKKDTYYLKRSIEQYLGVEQKNSSGKFYWINELHELCSKKVNGRIYSFDRADFVDDSPREEDKMLHIPHKQTSILDNEY